MTRPPRHYWMVGWRKRCCDAVLPPGCEENTWIGCNVEGHPGAFRRGADAVRWMYAERRAGRLRGADSKGREVTCVYRVPPRPDWPEVALRLRSIDTP